MNAIIVSVDYGPTLAVTLPWNRRHWDRVMVVTAPRDEQSQMVATCNDAELHVTNAFYHDDALFNKWKALEEGLDKLGRNGWLAIVDADVLWPSKEAVNSNTVMVGFGQWREGFIYTPLRRMHVGWVPGSPLPQESDWARFPLHPQQHEWAGYTQVFHADDPVLGRAPWHQQDWRHAGGADSFFQAKWPKERKVRPPFQVLHLGRSGENWGGVGKMAEVRAMIRKRGQGPDRFKAERISSRSQRSTTNPPPASERTSEPDG